MKLLADQWLATLNTLLQWIAVIGTGLGLASGIGLIFTRRELSDRQAISVIRANDEATAARRLAGGLQEEIERVKKYAYVSTLTLNGMVYTGGDVKMPTEISVSIEGTWQEVGPDTFRPVCESAALERNRLATIQFPDFPFSYYALAYCMKRSGDPGWRAYAEKAVAIFEQTTKITGYQKSHEQCLAYLRQQLGHVG
jgi:hypothetical protein